MNRVPSYNVQRSACVMLPQFPEKQSKLREENLLLAAPYIVDEIVVCWLPAKNQLKTLACQREIMLQQSNSNLVRRSRHPGAFHCTTVRMESWHTFDLCEILHEDKDLDKVPNMWILLVDTAEPITLCLIPHLEKLTGTAFHVQGWSRRFMIAACMRRVNCTQGNSRATDISAHNSCRHHIIARYEVRFEISEKSQQHRGNISEKTTRS